MDPTPGRRTMSGADQARVLRSEYLPDAMLLVKDGVVTWASPNVGQLLGWDAAGVVGAPLESLVHPDDRAAVGNGALTAGAGDHVTMVVRAAGEHSPHHAVEMVLQARHDAPEGEGDVVVAVRTIDATTAARAAVDDAALAAQRLAERAGDVFFVVDGRGLVLEAGAAAYELLGRMPQDLIGLALPQLIHEDDREASQRYRDDVRGDRANGSVQIRVRTRGGTFRWVRATGVVLADGGGDPAAARVMVSWRDIDSLVRETRFAERESARLRMIIDTALDPWLVLEPLRDAQGQVTDFMIEDANDGAAEYLRWPIERLRGTRLCEEFPNMAGNGLMRAYVDALDSREPVTIHDLAYPHDVFGETRMYEVRAHAVGGSLMLTWRDTTPATRARDELAHSEAFFRGVAATAGDVLVAGALDAVRWASPGAAALGATPGADICEVMSAIVVPDSVPSVRACCLLMSHGHDYAGRWHRPTAPALVVRATPTPGEGARWVMTMIEERWTDAGAAMPD